MGHPVQVKEVVVQKVLLGNKPHHEIAKEFGVGRSTIGKWVRQYKQNGGIDLKSKGKRPKDWSSEERISALIETGCMSPEERASWCRRKGIFPGRNGGPFWDNTSMTGGRSWLRCQDLSWSRVGDTSRRVTGIKTSSNIGYFNDNRSISLSEIWNPISLSLIT